MEQHLDAEAVRELEHELHTAIYPGTEIMKDVGLHHFVMTAKGAHTVLVPQPSDSEHDPLNWSPLWKGCTIACATMISFSQGFGPLALGPMFGDYIVAFDSNLTDVVQFTGIAILVLGFSNFVWRPVLIISSLICVGSSIWRARATSYNSFLGACILNGFGAGPAETAQPTIISDVIFLHDRGKYNTLYFASYFGALICGPLLSGPVAQYAGWRNFWWLNTALLAFAAVCCIFFFPETRFHRTLPSGSIYDPSRLETKPTPTVNHVPPLNNQNTLSVVRGDDNIEIQIPVQSEKGHTTTTDPWLGRGRPSKAQWKLAQPYSGNILRELWLPLQVGIFPVVAFAAFVVSWSASSYLTVNLTQSEAFAGPPYNLSSTKIGLFNLAIFIGALIGLVTAGPLSDIIAARLTTRNRGIREPEMRLLTMIPYVFVMLIGNVVVAVGYQRSWPWEAIVLIGYTFAGIQVAALPSIVSTYAVDSYKPVAGPIFVAITVNKNLWGYGFSKFITPWTTSSGYIAPIMTNTALTTLWCLFGIVFWYWGKTFRKWTAESKVHSM